MNLTFWEIAQVVQAENNWKQQEDFEVTGIEFDSRKIQDGNLFVPLAGTNDGHSYAQTALEKGAAAAFWSSQTVPPEGLAVLQVQDTLRAMQQLARYYRRKISPAVIGITGSNGKTTTKDMTEAVLAQKYRTYKTQGNYNNDIGLPYTILQMPSDTEKLILEMGMDHAGEISFLSLLAEPDVGAITMIGEAHIEYLGSRQEIAKAKMEIRDGLKKDGLLLIPNEEPLLEPFSEKIPQKIKRFGWTASADLQGQVLKTEKETTVFTISGMEGEYQIPLPGSYNVSNALIAAGIGQWFGLSDDDIRQGLAGMTLTKNRTEWLKAENGLEILSDVYNANPTAMNLVLDNFSQMSTAGKRVAVLGDMLELGPDSGKMHESVGEHLNQQEISEVFLYGAEMERLYQLLQPRYGQHVHYFEKEAKAALIKQLKEQLLPEDMVVLKGSNGMGLSEVVQALLD